MERTKCPKVQWMSKTIVNKCYEAEGLLKIA